MNVNEVLAQRGSKYGSFKDNAYLSYMLYSEILYCNMKRSSNDQKPLEAYQLEALKMICHKIARIVSGDPTYEDNWLDIAGYAELGCNPR